MDQFRALGIFIRVVERGSFSAAAADLGLSHGMASAVVRALERELKVELIRRTTRRMALTDEGRAFFDQGRRILEDFTTLKEAMSGRPTQISGRLSVQAPGAFSRLVLAPALGGFRQAHPELEMRLKTSDRLPDMISENLDAVIYVGPLPDSTLMARGFGAFPLVTAAAPAYLATRGEPRSLDDLADHDLIDIVSSTTGRRLDWQFRVEGQRLFRPARAALAFDNSEAAIAAAVSGAGIVQNISYALADPIAEGRLVPILADLRDPGSEVHLLTRRQDRPPARLRVFASLVDHVVRERRERDAAIFGPDRASA